jgi:pyridoxamine 5'-phosphate oxidase
MKTDDLRQEFMRKGLNHDELDQDPIRQFENWYTTTNSSDIHEPSAMSLATVDSDGQPWQRFVLLKMFDEDGFIFFTNYESRKAQHIASNPNVSLLFPWHVMARQVKITGTAEKISTAESLKYFATRNRGSQLGAWASQQSQMINSRSILETMVETMKRKYADKQVPLPPFWGGYRIRPSSLEFWQARESRLHDCFIYRRSEDNEQWYSERLAP